MTLQQLQYLISIAQYDSINQAAQSLFVSQSGISKSIKQLEDELGFRLLERTHRGVAFTAQGQEFLRDTYALIEQFDSFKLRYSASSHDIINFSVSSQHYIFVLGAVVKAAERKKDFRYTISLLEKKTSEIIEDVVSRRSQIGFVYYYDVTSEFMRRELERYNLVFHPFCEATPHVYLSVHHPLASASALSLSQLEHYPYVCYDLGTDPTHLAEEMFSPTHPSKLIYVTDRSSMLNIITHSNSYTIGSGFLYDSYIDPSIITTPLSVSGSNSIMHIGWIELKNQPAAPETQQFIQLCTEELNKCFTGNRSQPPSQPPKAPHWWDFPTP